ncbi:MAG: sulfatase [Myxococcales bacterium]|nr:sulfatase [Myxococcales bacterium]
MNRTWTAVGVALLALGGLVAVVWSVWGTGASGRQQADPTEVVMDPLRGPRATPPADAKSLVLVVACTLRKDQTSIHGAPPEITPFLSELAEAGTHFSDVITAAPWTRASATALLTGHHPISVGMVEEGMQRNERRLPSSVVTLAEQLRDHGWSTLGVTANPNLNDVYGFHQGFDSYRQLEQLWRARPIKVPGHLLIPRVEEALATVERGRPLFLQVVLIDAHAPFQAPARLTEQLALPDIPRAVASYRAVVHALDASIRKLDEALRRHGYTEENTILAVVNDHGEGLSWPEHHGRSHGRFLAPSTVGGVFLLRGPGVASGHVVSGITSGVDVMPTLLSLLGVPTVNGPGHDLAEHVRGQASVSPRTHAFTDTWYTNSSRAGVYTDDKACQLDFLKNDDPRGAGFEDGCFDRLADPLHERPYKDLELLLELRRWRRDRVLEARALPPTPRAEVGKGLSRQLEALGYVDGDDSP